MPQNNWNTGAPTKSDEYLVTLLLPDGIKEVTTRCFTVEGNAYGEPNSWEWESCMNPDEEVIAWMELPKPYEN